jgi:uncharacterized protein
MTQSSTTTSYGPATPAAPSRGRLRPLGLADVRITGGFWADRQRVNATATLEHCVGWMDRLGWTGNFEAVVQGRIGEGRNGREFSDSEVYKLSEALSWERARAGGTDTSETLDRLTGLVARAQHPDGYLSTAFGNPGQPARYTDLEWGHELYCYGHLIQAAVARARAEGDNELTAVGRRVADHVCATFGTDGLQGICGHPEIEPALVELARLTGEQRYLDQAALFVERRGHRTLADTELDQVYFSDDVPVRHARVLRGHAVRALYLAAGAVDVAVETGDDELLAAVEQQWETTVARRTYLTGGMGAHHSGESFGADFELPPDRAYAETCAGVASVMLSWRLLLATGNPRYADLIERTLYNVVAASPAADGRAFFYVNTLHRRERGVLPSPDSVSPRALSSLRSPWFAVSCCPNNVARTMASLAAYLVTTDGGGLQLHQYADAEVEATLDGGRRVAVSVRTAYPREGSVTVRVGRTDDRPWTLSLRVPSWATGAELVEPDGRRRPVSPGTVDVTRVFASGDVVRLDLPVLPRWVEADPRVDAVRGTLAVERGPLVLCVESPDLPGEVDVDAVRVDPSVDPVDRDGQVLVTGSLVRTDTALWPFQPAGTVPRDTTPTQIPLVPYNTWANRGPATMRVWLPRTAP